MEEEKKADWNIATWWGKGISDLLFNNYWFDTSNDGLYLATDCLRLIYNHSRYLLSELKAVDLEDIKRRIKEIKKEIMENKRINTDILELKNKSDRDRLDIHEKILDIQEELTKPLYENGLIVPKKLLRQGIENLKKDI